MSLRLKFHASRGLLLLLPLLSACHRGNAQQLPKDEPATVRAVPVTTEPLALPIVATGTLGPKEEVALGFKVGGVIARIEVDAGQSVRAGQTLAQLDVHEIDAAVTRAASAAEKAERDLARAQRLFVDSVVTRVQVQDAETVAQVARADLEAARFNRRYAEIVAPAEGVILRRKAEPGELVAPGAQVLVLGSRARGAVVRTGLADRDALRVQRGDSATVRFAALPDRVLRGTVTEIGGAAEPGTGTYIVEVTLPGAALLTAGLVGQVEIRPRERRLAAIVPVEAVLEADGSSATVFALSADGRHALRKRVTVAFLDGDRVAIASGLENVTRVLTDGAAYLDDGMAVKVVR